MLLEWFLLRKKLFGVVPLVTGCPCTNSTPFKIHSFVNIQLYGTVTFEPLVQFQNILEDAKLLMKSKSECTQPMDEIGYINQGA